MTSEPDKHRLHPAGVLVMILSRTRELVLLAVLALGWFGLAGRGGVSLLLRQGRGHRQQEGEREDGERGTREAARQSVSWTKSDHGGSPSLWLCSGGIRASANARARRSV